MKDYLRLLIVIAAYILLYRLRIEHAISIGEQWITTILLWIYLEVGGLVDRK